MKATNGDKVPSISSVPSLNESYCWSSNSTEIQINAHSVAKFTVVAIITLSIIISNLIFIVTINSQFYSKISNPQPQFRYLLTCLAINDFTIGVLVTAVTIVPALIQCWPLGQTVCQIQASLREVLPRQSVVILMCTAINCYISIRHPRSSQKCCINKICMLTISLSLVVFLSVFTTLVISRQGYYFNNSGLSGCDVFYTRPSFRILSACMYYFPATLLFMYCYGSLYHFSHKKYSRRNSSLRNFNLKSAKSPPKRLQGERRCKAVSRKMGTISFMFIVTSTPWFINEMVVGGTGYRVSSFFEFFFTYAALSNSFWNPFLYWSLDEDFRTSFVRILRMKNLDDDSVWANSTIKSVYYCHNNFDANTADKCGKQLENSHENNVDVNLYPSCPTPPPPPRIKKMIPLH